jgi:hypothetical protein
MVARGWEEEGDCQYAFDYNNYSIQIAGILAEIYLRASLGIEKHTRPFMLKDACIEAFFPRNFDPVNWPTKDENEAIGHSATFSGIQLTGYEMRDLARLLFTKYNSALRFIIGDPYVTHTGHIIENKFIVEHANDKNVDPGYVTQHKYKYSLGWWIPCITADEAGTRYVVRGRVANVQKKYISAQGWYGQRICFNMANGMIAIRKTVETPLTFIQASFQETFQHLGFNKHPSFIWHFSAYEDALDHLDYFWRTCSKDPQERARVCNEIVNGLATFLSDK